MENKYNFIMYRKRLFFMQKTEKKHELWENYTRLGGRGWGGVRPKAEKKIVSVGAISTFRHPLDQRLFHCRGLVPILLGLRCQFPGD